MATDNAAWRLHRAQVKEAEARIRVNAESEWRRTMDVSKTDSNAPKVLSPEERHKVERELNEVLAEMTRLLPRYKAPAFEPHANSRHEELAGELKRLGNKRDYLRR